MIHRLCILFVIAALLVMPQNPTELARADERAGSAASNTVFMPLIIGPPAPPARRVNAPYFNVSDVDTKFSELAVFWFGKVERSSNYADVRVGYNNNELYIYVAIFDRRIWYDEAPTPATLTNWDAVSLYLNIDGAVGSAVAGRSYRFVAQMNGGGSSQHHVAYQPSGSNWTQTDVSFTARPGWRGERLNDDGDDRGWAMGFRIPFSSLGLTGRPVDGTIWGMALSVHDRDAATSTSLPATLWPPTANLSVPSTWGGLRFGLPGYTPPTVSSTSTYTIRHRLNGANVPDGMVGGGFTCGDGLDFWTQWGEQTYYMLPDSPGEERGDFNIQNQSDIADWPCFARNYVTFPLDSLPPGLAVVSATLTLHQFGQSGQPGSAKASLIQVLTVGEDWNESALNWNNAPVAVENVSQAWVPPTPPVGWPGTPRTWNVSRAVAQAYANGQPLRLALYSGDSDYDSGKYFVSSDTGDWNAQGRPTLTIILGQP